MKIRRKESSYDAADAGGIGGVSGGERTDLRGSPGGWPDWGGETLEKWKFILGFSERRRCWTTSGAGDKGNATMQEGYTGLYPHCVEEWPEMRSCITGSGTSRGRPFTIFRRMLRLPLARWQHCFGLRKGQESIAACFSGFRKVRIPTGEILHLRPVLATPTKGDIRWALMYWDSTEDGPW